MGADCTPGIRRYTKDEIRELYCFGDFGNREYRKTITFNLTEIGRVKELSVLIYS